jgi:thiol-disulfide isomerase/thioredoxin
MFNQYEPNVKATINFLQQLKVKVNAATVNETLQNHPDWPSLLCISDSLQKWNIPNAAAKISPEDIDELPTPFIAYTQKQNDRLVTVNNVANNAVTYYAPVTDKTQTQNKTDFIKEWGGIYIIAEPAANAGEKDYAKNKRQQIISRLVPAALILLLVVLAVAGFNNSLANYFAVSNIALWCLFAVTVTGVVVTSLLLWYELDKNNPLLQKVCTGITHGNCTAILTGKAAKVFNWLSWSEVGLFFFAGNLLVVVISNPFVSVISTQEISIAALACLHLLALPYIIFSLYYQWRIAKQWCVLCLAVQALLFAGGVIILIGGLYKTITANNLAGFYTLLPLYAIAPLLWFTIKPYLKKLQAAKQTKREYLRIKFNSQIFDTLLKKQKQITEPVEGLGIAIGNPAAKNTLIKVCNPYCGPCAKAHPKMEKLLEEIPDVKAQILFTTPNEKNNFAYKPVSHLLAIAAENNEVKTKQALDDWYLANEKDYETFAGKYKMNGQLAQQGEKIEAMQQWCNTMKVTATPTFFINGYELPDAYSIEDLEYFLHE